MTDSGSEIAAAPHRRTATQAIEAWADLMDTCHEFLLVGLRRKVGPDGDVAAAYREWYAKRMDEHDAMIVRMAERFGRRTQANGE